MSDAQIQWKHINLNTGPGLTKIEVFLLKQFMAFWMGTIKGRGNLSHVNFLCFYCTSEVSGPLQLGDASTNAEGKISG